ncbi:MAG: YhgE/Pip family protein [Sarcina sp.]
MKNALKVFKRDLKGVIKNPISLLIISGLCILPSLYSFLNVIGCWNAYTNTSKVPIAIVNEDKGATIGGQNLNVGNNIVENLKTNNSIDWEFVDSSEGNIGLATGKYFAELIIPPDFSSDLSSISGNNPIKPQLTYRVNTKMGPVANKITEVAQQTLLAQIKASIMSTLSQQVFTKLNSVGNTVQQNKDQILNLKSAIINLNLNMGNITSALNGITNSADDITGYLNTVKSTMPVINGALTQIQQSNNNIEGIVSNTRSVLNNSIGSLGENLDNSKSLIASTGTLANNLLSTQSATTTLNQIISQINIAQGSINNAITFLKSLSANNSAINNLIAKLQNVDNLLTKQKDNIDNVINSGQNISSAYINLIKTSTDNSINAINSTIDYYNNSAKQALSDIGNGYVSAANTASNVINETKNLNTNIDNVLGSASASTTSASDTSKMLVGYLNQYKGLISNLSASLSNLSNNDLNQIISLLQGNPLVIGNFASSPFTFKQEVIYPVANYGSGMTPVYSVLAFWVGMLIAGALLKTDPPKFPGSERMTIREKHFGKMLIFIAIAIVQSLVITFGCKYLVGVQVVNMPLFVLGSLVTSITFAIIVFTFLSIFGHIGDAICIVLMVVQLSGTGGTYPVQAMPMFFRIIEPFVPFPYGVNLMREAIGGPYWPNAIKDIACLCVFAIVFIIFGYFVKPKLNYKFEVFEEKFKESGIADE